jgi:hypothetical protein
VADRSWNPLTVFRHADLLDCRLRYSLKTNNKEKTAVYRYNDQMSMRYLDPGCRVWATPRGEVVLTANGRLSVDEPIGAIHAHSSVVGGTLALITVPEHPARYR